MTTEFQTKVVLDTASATKAASDFGKAVRKSSTVLQQFQEVTKKAAQGGAKNVFRQYENSVGKLNMTLRNSVSAMHKNFSQLKENQKELRQLTRRTRELTDNEKARVSALTQSIDKDKQVLSVMIKLNQKYDENARVVAKAKRIRNELNLVVASGLKTKKEAVAIFRKEAQVLREGTAEYKKAAASKKADATQLEKLKDRYLSSHLAQKRIIEVTKELNLLVSKNIITKKRSIEILKKERKHIIAITNSQHKLNASQSFFARVARKVSIASRVMLTGYLALAGVRAWINMSKTAESVVLLEQKLTLLTGDSGAYKKLFTMTQEVGIKLNEASRIMTRFSVVTNRAFSAETMVSWISTLTKSARATGTSTQEMTGALIQITQAMSAGRLMGDEYRSVTENLPLFTVALRKVFKGTTLSLKELSSQGLITNDRLIEGFQELAKMVEGIPGTVGTVEAQLGSLSSAWDNMISKMLGTDTIKVTIQIVTEFVNLFSGGGEKDLAQQAKEKAKALAAKIDNATIFSLTLRNSIDRVESGTVTKSRAQGSSSIFPLLYDVTDANLDKSKKLLETVEADLAQYKLTGQTRKEYLQEIHSQTANETQKAEAIKEAQEKRAKEFARIVTGSAKISTLRELADLEIQKINRSTEVKEGNLAPRSLGEAGQMKKSVREKLAIDIIKIKTKEVNESIRLQNLSSSIDTKDLRDTNVYSGSIIKIRKDLEKNLEKINTQILRGKKEIADSDLSLGDTDGLGEGDGIVLLAEHRSAAEKAITDELRERQNVVNSLTAGGSGGSSYEIYLESIRRLSIKNQTEQSKLTEIYRTTATEGTRLKDTEAEAQEKLNEKYREALALIKKTRREKLEDEFSPGIKSAREYTQAVERLNEAKALGTIMGADLVEAERQLAIAYLHTNNLIMAQNGTMSESEQLWEGMKDGMIQFGETTKTTFEQMSELTKSSIGGMADLLTEFVTTGKADFKGFALDIIKSIIRIQIQAALSAAINSVLQAAGITTASSLTKTAADSAAKAWAPAAVLASLGSSGGNAIPAAAGIISTFALTKALSVVAAKGEAFDSGGVSAFAKGGAFTNTVVNKPTLFPFVNGTGLMGEAGPEAIMPLSRNSSGQLGVKISGGSASSGKAGNVQIINQGAPIRVVSNTVNGNDRRIIITEAVEQARSAIAADIMVGDSDVSDSLEGIYGVNRAIGARR